MIDGVIPAGGTAQPLACAMHITYKPGADKSAAGNIDR